MQPVFQADCPHCGTRRVSFSIVCESPRLKHQDSNVWDCLADCANCTCSVLAVFFMCDDLRPTEAAFRRDLARHELLRVSPSGPRIPEYVPENIAAFYDQGLDSLYRNFDAAGAMFRKSLDIALRMKFPDVEGSLKQRIDRAAKQHMLTEDLAEWSHRIRLGGNTAIHEDRPYTQEEAQHLQVFCDLVLRYLFTLPGMLAKARQSVSVPALPSP